ncbi:CCA tRNA nucleotidyltransferase [Candidatus Woesearchaeota archaeon]|nr:CCA tRNA nucleotidyltransferase [Candidatus Woesearchaeota archaeon]
MKALLQEVLKEIKPSKKEEKEVADRIKKVIAKVQKLLPQTKVILGGSGQKGTWLRTAHDADIFVRFPASQKSATLADILGKALKKGFSVERLHGSRDYYRFSQNGFTFEIVPILNIKKAEQAENITDVSPLHSKWVRKHKKYVDEIRLTKQFFKAVKVYGAESYINGFSGYISEILTIYYKGFMNVMKAISRWKPKVIIDIENYHKGKKLLFELDKAKTRGPLVVIDPVQASRNAAAAVSEERFYHIIAYAKAFLKKPSTSSFEIKPIDKNMLKRKGALYIYKVLPKKGKKDIIGCKIVKAFEHMKKEIVSKGFTLKAAEWEWPKEAFLYFVVKPGILSKEAIFTGPPSKMKYHAKQFRKKHRDVYEKKGTLYAKEKRQYRKPDGLMKAFIKDEYIKEKVRGIDLL